MRRLTFPYSLGDAIDWKRSNEVFIPITVIFPYSLGDAIDWKLNEMLEMAMYRVIPYSLGDAIDWKLEDDVIGFSLDFVFPLLARGRDRLETGSQ